MSNTAYHSTVDSVGNTPLVRLNHLTSGLKANVYLKCEFRNPSLSIKDRIAAAMIKDAEEKGLLQPGSIIIEPTSGNTGIGLASVSKARGYQCILVMPETMSLERRVLLNMLGAEIVLTPGAWGMTGAITKARMLLNQYGQRAFGPQQFENPVNPLAHYQGTGPEIWAGMEGKIDAFVAAVGTGGTISGTGKFLKEQSPGVKVVAVEPLNSAVLSGGTPSAHVIQGVGAGFIPNTLDLTVIDEIIKVSDEDTINTARLLSNQEGILAGLSSGANVRAALELAKRPEFEGKNIVTVAPSGTERYMSTTLVKEAREEALNLKALPIDE